MNTESSTIGGRLNTILLSRYGGDVRRLANDLKISNELVRKAVRGKRLATEEKSLT